MPSSDSDLPKNQWSSPSAPNGRVLGFGLRELDEDALLRQDKQAALYALGTSGEDYHPEREALIFVHGLGADPHELESLVEALWTKERYQLYLLCFDDWNRRTTRNGRDLADELLRLAGLSAGARRSAVIIAHSMGGIVARRALNVLSLEGGAQHFGRVRVVAVDTPWHGFNGPSDRPPDRIFIDLARPFIPDGLEDMRARSAMFVGDPEAAAAADRIGLFQAQLADPFSIHMVFAEQGDDVYDYSEGPLAELSEKLVPLYRDDAAPSFSEPRLQNFWAAILSSEQYFAFQDHLRALQSSAKLDAPAITAALRRFYPRFAGNHLGVIATAPGQPRFIDYLLRLLEV
jgi:pimeloyl-ACP methyl ester carboxylesterase